MYKNLEEHNRLVNKYLKIFFVVALYWWVMKRSSVLRPIWNCMSSTGAPRYWRSSWTNTCWVAIQWTWVLPSLCPGSSAWSQRWFALWPAVWAGNTRSAWLVGGEGIGREGSKLNTYFNNESQLIVINGLKVQLWSSAVYTANYNF